MSWLTSFCEVWCCRATAAWLAHGVCYGCLPGVHGVSAQPLRLAGPHTRRSPRARRAPRRCCSCLVSFTLFAAAVHVLVSGGYGRAVPRRLRQYPLRSDVCLDRTGFRSAPIPVKRLNPAGKCICRGASWTQLAGAAGTPAVLRQRVRAMSPETSQKIVDKLRARPPGDAGVVIEVAARAARVARAEQTGRKLTRRRVVHGAPPAR